MVKVIEDSKEGYVGMHCTRCHTFKTVGTKNVKMAYVEINRFRKEHEHLPERRR